MDFVNICVYAMGYHSGAEYQENIAIRRETYEKLKKDLEELSIYIGELDGKHSSCEADIEFQELFEDDFIYARSNSENSGDVAYWDIAEIFEKNNMDFEQEIKITKDYIDSLDILVPHTVYVSKSLLEEFEKYVKKFNKK